MLWAETFTALNEVCVQIVSELCSWNVPKMICPDGSAGVAGNLCRWAKGDLWYEMPDGL
jgi:hypothetical protein